MQGNGKIQRRPEYPVSKGHTGTRATSPERGLMGRGQEGVWGGGGGGGRVSRMGSMVQGIPGGAQCTVIKGHAGTGVTSPERASDGEGAGGGSSSLTHCSPIRSASRDSVAAAWDGWDVLTPSAGWGVSSKLRCAALCRKNLKL